jgi:hypothetical protein
MIYNVLKIFFSIDGSDRRDHPIKVSMPARKLILWGALGAAWGVIASAAAYYIFLAIKK